MIKELYCFKEWIIIYIREKIQLVLAYLLALIGIGLIFTLIISGLELVPQPMQVDCGGFVFITSPILAIISAINFVIFNIFHKSTNCTSMVNKKFLIAFILGVIPYGLIIADIAFFGF